jgi:hypothetical protein
MDVLILPISTITFDHGIDISYSPVYNLKARNVLIPKGFRFDGNVNFMGINTYALIDFKESIKPDNYGNKELSIKLVLPSFTLGHSNIQILSFDDFYIKLTEDEK